MRSGSMAGAGTKPSGLGGGGAFMLAALLLCRPLYAQDTVPNLNEVCGRSIFAGKIFGGSKAEPERWPWQASLLLYGRHVCGAALIDSNWVVSAAHCFQRSRSPTDYRILLGYNQLSRPSNYSRQMTVRKLFVHPDYDRLHYQGSDICLMQLHLSVEFNSHIRPACLLQSGMRPDPAVPCWITGWGMITENEFLGHPLQMQEAQLTLIDSQTCHDFFQPPSQPPKPIGVFEDMVCAGDIEGRRSICRGDSGGPLVCPLNGTWYLVGLTSWSLECQYPVSPNVFTNLSHFSEWIRTHKLDTPPANPSEAPPQEKPPSLSFPNSASSSLNPRSMALLSLQILLLWLALFSV